VPNASSVHRYTARSPTAALVTPTLRPVDDYFAAMDARQGFIARSDVLQSGYDDRFIRHQLHHRAWTRIRNGSYAIRTVWEGLDPVQRHARLARAVVHAHGDAVALSHVSGLIVRGSGDVWGIDLGRVHVTRRDGRSGSLDRDVVHHDLPLHEAEVELVDGVPVVPEGRCIGQTILSAGVEAGLVVADSALHNGRLSMTQLEELREAMRRHPGSRTLDLVARLADGRAESVGESRSRYVFWSQGLPQPELQYAVFDEQGLVGYSDLALPEHHLLFEFDGRVKYGRMLAPGQEPGDVVFAEKLREDRMRRATGFAFERCTWADLSVPGEIARRIRRRMVGPA
jgi:hypothetical protein